jgi:acyl carrier protein
LVSEIEREFHVKIPDADLTPRRFDSLERIGAYLTSRTA